MIGANVTVMKYFFFISRLILIFNMFNYNRDFHRPDLPSKLINEQKLSKMVFIIPNFLVLHFGENFMKIQQK